MGTPRGGRQQAMFAVADQGLSSASNFLLGVVVARSVSVTGYGAFAIGFSVYGIALVISRAVGTDALLVRFSDRPEAEQRDEAGRALGAATGFGLVIGLVLAAVGLAVGDTVGRTCVAFGAGLPVLFAQEAYRYVFIMTRRAHLAAANDLLWTLVFATALVLPAVRDATSPGVFVVAWCAAAALAVLVAAVHSGVRPRVRHAWSWARDHRDLAGRYAAEYAVSTAGSHLVIYLTGVIAGFEEGGALRGAYVVMAPVWVLATGIVAAAVPEGVRLKRRSLAGLERRVYVLAATLAGLAFFWGVLVAAAPDSVGRALLGDTWDLSRHLLPPLGIVGAGIVASGGLISGLRSLADARRSLAATVPTGLLMIACATAGAVVGDARTVVLAMIVPSWMAVAAAAWQFRASITEARTRELAGSTGP